MGLLAAGQSFLSRVMTAEAQPVMYERDGVSIPMMVNPDSPQDVQTSQGHFVVGQDEADFAMNVADLGEFAVPQDGDHILWLSAGTLYTYTVLPDNSGGCFNWLDNRHLRLVAHAKVKSSGVSP